MKAILEFAVDDYNERLNLNKTEVYVRGVQIWKEPLAGYINTTLQDVSIQLNGITYGMESPVSISDNPGLSDTELQIYLNPTKDYLYVEMELHGEKKLNVADANGSVFLRKQLQNGINAIDLSGLGKGVCFVTTWTSKGAVIEKLLLH